jgi:hypothetical protein
MSTRFALSMNETETGQELKMNDVDFGTVRLQQDVGPGTYTNTYDCQFHSPSLSLSVSAVHFGVFHWSTSHAGFRRSTLHQTTRNHIQRLKAKE